MRGGNRSSYILGGLLLMWIRSCSGYHTLLHHVPLLYIASVVALLENLSDRQAGLRLAPVDSLAGGFHLQVSEFVKLVIILLVARYLTELKTDELELREMLKLAGFGVDFPRLWS